jgi:tRNA (guanine-N7-)-methyltransferase
MDLRSFGRRHGRVLSARQKDLLATALPRFGIDLAAPAPERLADLFAISLADVWLEIGFGGAEHLLWQAEHHPDVGIIGCEPYQDGVVKALAGIDASGLGNVRLWPDDARPLVDWLPTRSIGRAFILFPDPWPKTRQQKRRLVNTQMLASLARVVRPGGTLRIATDIGDYARAILIAVGATPAWRWSARQAADWRTRPADWPPTRYEAKAVAAGRRCTYLTLTRA